MDTYRQVGTYLASLPIGGCEYEMTVSKLGSFLRLAFSYLSWERDHCHGLDCHFVSHV